MMFLPVLRPVQKSASRLLLAGTNAAVEISDHGVPLEVQPPTTAVYPNWSQAVQIDPRLTAAQWQGARWPVAVENLLAGASGSRSSREPQEEQDTTLESQPDQGRQASETGAQCMWQLDAHAAFPPGACVWPAVFMTSDGCFSAGFPVASVPADVLQPPVQQAQTGDVQGQEAASSGSSSPRGLRTSASRKQRRRLKAAADSAAADEVQLKAQPALPGLITAPRAEAPALPSSPLAEEPQQLWPPTPESTPPCTPRYMNSMPTFCAFPGVWQMEMPVANESFQVSQAVTEDIPDEETQACEQMICQLDDEVGRAEVLELLWSSAWSMSCSPGGTRVVQKALEVADTPERMALAEQLRGHVKEAFASPHANHVLQKCIELIPPERLGFVLAEMQSHTVAAARHRYGCRVLERLLEHCPTEQTAPLVEEVLAGAPQLCRHTFGNFVVQHVLEHGTVAQKHRIVEVIHADIQRLARHRVASHVVRCALKHSAPEDRHKLVQAIRKDPADLADLAHHHCGSFVVREMRRADGARH